MSLISVVWVWNFGFCALPPLPPIYNRQYVLNFYDLVTHSPLTVDSQKEFTVLRRKRVQVFNLLAPVILSCVGLIWFKMNSYPDKLDNFIFSIRQNFSAVCGSYKIHIFLSTTIVNLWRDWSDVSASIHPLFCLVGCYITAFDNGLQTISRYKSNADKFFFWFTAGNRAKCESCRRIFTKIPG